MSLELDVPDDLMLVVAATLTAIGVEDGHLSLDFVDEERIRQLNRDHRGKDEPTDVLSFPVDGTHSTVGPRELGDIVICHRQTADVTEATVHGVLHLCGYDHENDDGEMLTLQAKVLADLRNGWRVGSPPDEIREAGYDDVSMIVRAYDWLFAPPGSKPEQWDPEIAADRLRAAIDSPDATVLVAESLGIAGFCTAYLDLLSVRFGLRCWVEDLAVDPEFRSQGIGAALLAAARDWAASHGATHLELDSAMERTDAHRFYDREGANRHSICFGWDPLEDTREDLG